MEQRISLVTLGVDDLGRARAFYAALGWRGQEVEETVFLQAGPMALVLWDRRKLAADSGVSDSGVSDSGVSDTGVSDTGVSDTGGGFDGVVLAQNVRSTAEVDAVVDAARGAGATVTRDPAPTFYGGYAGVFLDPDGHAWEIAFNPGFTLDDDGALVLPTF